MSDMKRKEPEAPVEKKAAGGLLGIIGSVSAMPMQAKRAKPSERNMGADPFQTLAARLHQIRDTFHAKLQELGEGCVVEIEAKLGLIVDGQTDGRTGPFLPGAGAIEILPAAMKGKKFVSGVSKKDFDAYSAVQEKLPNRQKIKSLTHAYSFPNRTRVQTDNAVPPRIIMEQKTKELEFQVHLPSCPYDCRITVSIERPLEASEQQEVGLDWESHRIKDRSSYNDGREGHPHRSKWQADLTNVTTKQGAEDGQGPGGVEAEKQSFEVELELKAEDCTQWIKLDDAKLAHTRTCEVAHDLWQRLSSMMPPEETAGALIEIKDLDVESAGQRACLAPFDAMDGARSGADFPGTLPIGFSRKELQRVQRDKYMVSEKTDGVRHFLVVVQLEGKGPIALLFDRKFKAWTMEGMEELGLALGVGTCLDGEVVRVFFDVFVCVLEKCGPWRVGTAGLRWKLARACV